MSDLPPLRDRIPQLVKSLSALDTPKICLNEAWSSDIECLFALLNSAINLRGSGNPIASLQILEWLDFQGVEHPLVVDNLIRGLIDSNRFVEANFLIPSLAKLDSGDVLRGAIDALATHQKSLLMNIKRHCDESYFKVVPGESLENIDGVEFIASLFSFCSCQINGGNLALAKVILEEIMHWGTWSLDVIPLELRMKWAELVVDLGNEVWHDLGTYEYALDELKKTKNSDQYWKSLVVDLDKSFDIGFYGDAIDKALKFVVKHPMHEKALIWLAQCQFTEKDEKKEDAIFNNTLEVERALNRDERLLDYWLHSVLTDDFNELS